MCKKYTPGFAWFPRSGVGIHPATLQRCVTLERHCPQLSIVGAGHARDEEVKAKYCSQNIAGMALLLRRQ